MDEKRKLIENSENVIVETLLIRDQLADIIRRMIIKGELKAGELITERQLSRQFGISTTPIKEALRILQAEGMVYVKPRIGTFVTKISEDNIYQLVAMRGAMEGVAAGIAAQKRTESEILSMQNLLDEVKCCISKGIEKQRISRLNESFHRILRGASQNEYLVNLINNMNSIDRTIRTLSFELEEAAREAQEAYGEHCTILQAVIDQDAELAESLMNQHIRRVATRVVGEAQFER